MLRSFALLRLFALTSALTLITFLLACGGNAKPAPAPGQPTPTTPTPAPGTNPPTTPSPTPAPSPAPTPAPAPAPTPAPNSPASASGADYVYVGDQNTISGATINVQQAAMHAIPGSPFATSADFVDIARARDLVFVETFHPGLSGQSTGELDVYRSDAATGALSLVKSIANPLSPQFPETLFTDSSQQFLYMSPQSNGELVYGFKIDQAIGSLTPIPGSPFTTNDTSSVGWMRSAVFSPDGKLLFGIECPVFPTARQCSEFIVSMQRDPNTGALTRPANNSTRVDVNALAISPNAKFVLSTFFGGDVHVFRFDSSGTLTEAAGSPIVAPDEPCAVAVHSSGKFVYVGSHNHTLAQPGTLSGYTVDDAGKLAPINGATVTTGAADPGNCALDFSPSGSLTFANTSALEGYSVTSSGALTPLAGSPQATGPAPHAQRKPVSLHSNLGQ